MEKREDIRMQLWAHSYVSRLRNKACSGELDAAYTADAALRQFDERFPEQPKPSPIVPGEIICV